MTRHSGTPHCLAFLAANRLAENSFPSMLCLAYYIVVVVYKDKSVHLHWKALHDMCTAVASTSVDIIYNADTAGGDRPGSQLQETQASA